MERIATGLFDGWKIAAMMIWTRQALVSRLHADGFNANMCKAVLDISKYSTKTCAIQRKVVEENSPSHRDVNDVKKHSH